MPKFERKEGSEVAGGTKLKVAGYVFAQAQILVQRLFWEEQNIKYGTYSALEMIKYKKNRESGICSTLFLTKMTLFWKLQTLMCEFWETLFPKLLSTIPELWDSNKTTS